MTLQTLSEHEIIVTFLALALLLVGAYLCGKLMEAIKAPKVVGEIIGGLLFGGTFLYHFFPAQMESIFMAYPEQGKVLNLFYQLGLVFLMWDICWIAFVIGGMLCGIATLILKQEK